MIKNGRLALFQICSVWQDAHLIKMLATKTECYPQDPHGGMHIHIKINNFNKKESRK